MNYTLLIIKKSTPKGRISQSHPQDKVLQEKELKSFQGENYPKEKLNNMYV